MELLAKYTRHSGKRCQQRGITRDMIRDTIIWGELIRKQGLRYFIMTDRQLSYLHEGQYNDRIRNLVVILTADNSILTVYKNSKAMRLIKKKPRRLFRKLARSKGKISAVSMSLKS